MKKTNILLMIMSLIALFSITVFASISTTLVKPADGFYWLKGGIMSTNLTFNISASPNLNILYGAIQNVTIWHNASGTFKANYTNTTIGSIYTPVTEIFAHFSNQSIFANNINDDIVFVWNAVACDNVTSTTNETVTLLNYKGVLENVNFGVTAVSEFRNATNESNIISQECNFTSAGAITCNSSVYNPIYVDYTHSSCTFAGSNRTIYVEDTPTITLNSPSDNGYSKSSDVAIIYNSTGDSSTYHCYLYTNDTGTFSEDGSFSIITNNTRISIDKQISEGNGIKWNVKCYEDGSKYPNVYGWATANRTINVDLTTPLVNIISPNDNSGQNYAYSIDGYKGRVYLNVTDLNPSTCILKLNGSLNKSVTSIIGGTPFYMYFNASDNNYVWNVECNDSAGNKYTSTNRSLRLDTVMDTLNQNINYSVSGTCNKFKLQFTFSGEVNATFKYGLTTMSQTSTLSNSSFKTNHTFMLDFGNNHETNFYGNITFCDFAGNCNNSFPQTNVVSPYGLCTGWTLLSVHDTVINLTDLYTSSSADYVYAWNRTGQSWIAYSTSSTSHAGYLLRVGDVMFLYDSNTTYFRDLTARSGYKTNISMGHNFLGLYTSFSFGNLSNAIFKNQTGGNQTPAGFPFQINYFSSYNNSNHEYVNHRYTWKLQNTTALGNVYNGLDTLWAYSNFTITVNVTTNGYVYANYTG